MIFSKKNIINALHSIADKEYQRRAWFNIGPEVSSPDEDICILYDDYWFEDFLNDASSPINQTERQAGLEFNELFRRYLESHDTSDPYIVFDNEDWNHVRNEAARLIKGWSI